MRAFSENLFKEKPMLYAPFLDGAIIAVIFKDCTIEIFNPNLLDIKQVEEIDNIKEETKGISSNVLSCVSINEPELILAAYSSLNQNYILKLYKQEDYSIKYVF